MAVDTIDESAYNCPPEHRVETNENVETLVGKFFQIVNKKEEKQRRRRVELHTKTVRCCSLIYQKEACVIRSFYNDNVRKNLFFCQFLFC